MIYRDEYREYLNRLQETGVITAEEMVNILPAHKGLPSKAEPDGRPVASNAIRRLFDVGRGLAGASLEYRRTGVTWPKPYRARIFASKNERDEYRVCGFGDSEEEAAIDALRQIGSRLASGS